MSWWRENPPIWRASLDECATIKHIDYSYSFTYPLSYFPIQNIVELPGHISTISRNYEISYIKEIFYKIVILPFLPNEVPFIELYVWKQQNLKPCTLMYNGNVNQYTTGHLVHERRKICKLKRGKEIVTRNFTFVRGAWISRLCWYWSNGTHI